MNKIGIYGIDGLYNYGCEAIVRGLVSHIKLLNPEAEITYYSRRVGLDSKVISDLGIHVRCVNKKSMYFLKVINKLLRFFKLKKILYYDNWNLIIKNSNIVFSIGGDMYTIPKHLRNHDTYTYKNQLVEFGEFALKNDIKYIIYGCSIGPFGKYKEANEYFFNHLNKVDLILTREQRCFDFLKENMNSENVFLYPDPAFFLEGDYTVKHTKRCNLALNISPLSFYEVYGELTDTVVERLGSLIKSIIVELDYCIDLIPHVISENNLDNDYEFMKKIYENLDDFAKSKTKLHYSTSFMDAKSVLQNCDVVVACRMHCAINAVCENVPTIFVSYSEKSIGMCRMVYGDENYVIKIEDMMDKDKMIKLIKKVGNEKVKIENNIKCLKNRKKYIAIDQVLSRILLNELDN